MPDPDDDPDDRPRRRRRREDDEDDEYDDRPRRRRPPSDDGLQYVVPINTNVLAIMAGYAGLVSVLCIPAPFAVILGILALVQLKRNPGQHGHGRAIFGIVMGVLCLLPVPVIAVAALMSK